MVALFGFIIALQLVVAVVSIDVLSAVRAYVTGESLYSKGQKDAQIYLLDYAQYHKGTTTGASSRRWRSPSAIASRAKSCNVPTPTSRSRATASSRAATIPTTSTA